MASRMKSLLPLVTMLAGTALAMALIGSVAARLESGEPPATPAPKVFAAAPAR